MNIEVTAFLRVGSLQRSAQLQICNPCRGKGLVCRYFDDLCAWAERRDVEYFYLYLMCPKKVRGRFVKQTKALRYWSAYVHGPGGKHEMELVFGS